MADKKVQVIYEMIAQLNSGNLNQGIKKINDQLKGIKLSDRMTIEYKEALKEVERLTDNFQASIKLPLTDDKALQNAIKDYKALERSLVKFQNVINKAGLDIKDFKWLPDHKDFEKFQLADQVKAELEEAESALKEAFKTFKNYHFNPRAARTGKLKLNLNPEDLIDSATTPGGKIPYSLSKADYAAEAVLKRELTELTKEMAKAETALAESIKKRQGLEKEPSTEATQEEIKALDILIEKQEDAVKTKEAEKKTLSEDIKAVVELRNAYYELKKASKLGIEDLSEYAKKGEGVNEILQRIAREGAEAFADALVRAGFAAEDVQKVLKDFDAPIKKQEEYNEKIKEGERDMKNLQSQLLNFFSVSNGWNLVRKVMRNAFNVVKDLDAAMTDIAVVTEMTLDQVWAGRDVYSKTARELGAATLDVVKASTLYYQQGLSEAEVNEATTETIKMGRIARIDGARATDLMTSAVRGFNLEMKDSIMINDTYSQIAAKSAANVEELANAMTKTASIAHSAGADFQNMTAFLAQMIETTREPSESLGTAMKTIVARFQEMKKAPDEIGEIDGEIVDANALEKALRTVGIALRNTDGEFRNFDDVIFEISEKWGTMDKMAQRHIATMAAGSRQQSRFIALVQNHNRLMELTGYATDSAGASNEQFEKTLDSLEAKMNQMKNALDLLWTTLMNSDAIKFAIDAITTLVETINKITKSLGSFGGSITGVILAVAAFKGGGVLLRSVLTSIGLATKATGQDVVKLTDRIKNLAEWILKFRKTGSDTKDGIGFGTELAKDLKQSWQEADRLKSKSQELGNQVAKAGSLSTIAALKVIAPYAAAVAAVIGLIVVIEKLIVTDKERLKQLQENIEKYQESINNAQNAIEDLTNSFEGLRSAEETLENLVTGTKEWKQALIEVNNKVIDLITDYPELAAHVERVDGALTITDEGYDKFIDQQQKKILSQQRAQLFTQVEAAQLEFKIDMKQFSGLMQQMARQFNMKAETVEEVFETFIKMGGSIKELENVGSYSSRTLEELFENADGAVGSFQEFSRAVQNNEDKFVRLGQAVSGANAQLEGLMTSFFSLIDEEDPTIGPLLKDEVTRPIIEAIFEANEKTPLGLQADILVEKANIDQQFGAQYGMDAASSFELLKLHYANVMEISKDQVDILIKEKELTKDMMLTELATKKVMDDFLENVNTQTAEFRKQSKTPIGEALLGLASKDFQKLTGGDLTLLQTALKDDRETLVRELAGHLDIDVDELLGLAEKTQEDIKSKFRDKIDGSEAYDSLTQDMAYEAETKFANFMSSVLARGGEGAANGILDLLSSTLGHLKGDKLTEALDIVFAAGITDSNQIKEVLSDLENLEGVLDDDQIDFLTKAWIKLNKAIDKTSFEDFQEGIRNVNKIIADIKKGNFGNIDEELYQQLIGIDPSLQSSFLPQLDGTYRYVGLTTEKLIVALQENTTTLAEGQRARLEGKVQAGELLSTSIWDKAYKPEDIAAFNTEDQLYYIKDFLTRAKYQELDSSLLGIDNLTNESIFDLEKDENIINEVFFQLREILLRGADQAAQDIATLDFEQKVQDATLSTPGQLSAGIAASIDLGDVEGADVQILALKDLAIQAGVSKEALFDFQKGITSLDKEERKAAARTLEHEIALYKLSQTIESTADTIYGQLKSLEDLSEGSLEYNHILSQIAKTMEEAFGLDLNEKFFQDAENLNLLTESLAGNEEAWKRLVLQMQGATLGSEIFAEEYGIAAQYIANITNELDQLSFEIDGTANLTQLFQSFLDAGLAAEEAAKAIEALGYTGVQYKVEYDDDFMIVTNPTNGFPEIIPIKKPRLVGEVFGTSTAISAARNIPSFGSGSKARPTTGGGGGGGGDKEEAPWEQSYDWLYNILQKTNDEIRKRNKLEWIHDKIIKDKSKTAQDLLNNVLEQEESLENQLELLKQQQSGRESERDNLRDAYSGVSQYVTFGDRFLEIDYDAISQVEDKATGELIDKAISEGERVYGHLDEIESNQMDTIDKLVALQDLGKNEWLELEDRVLNALIAQYQHEIDELSLINDSINNTNSRLIDAIQKSLNQIRQDRENEKKITDIRDKEARLAYLRQDTSGANRLEILALEQDLSDSKESYTDELIDQKINELQEQNDLAAEQRERQIELGQVALETAIKQGELWNQVYQIMSGMLDETGGLSNDFATFLSDWEEGDKLSTVGKEEWQKELEANATKGVAWLVKDSGFTSIHDALAHLEHGEVGMAEILENKANKAIKEIEALEMSPVINVAAPIVNVSVTGNTVTTSTTTNPPPTTYYPPPVSYTGKLVAQGVQHASFDIQSSTGHKYRVVSNAAGLFLDDKKISADELRKLFPNIKWLQQSKAFKTGGLADYTGPAWLDGTPGKPELVLNAKDTQNFIQLKNILSDIMSGGDFSTKGVGGGSSYYDIRIEVDELASDYDVDKLIVKIKKELAENGAYRNTNVVSRRMGW